MISRLAAPLLGAVLLGCVSEDAGHGDVRRLVQERMRRDVRWDHVAGRSVSDEATRKLLSEPLSSDGAVQVALYNNVDLQASFEELGIARGELVRAFRLPNPELEGAMLFHGDEPKLDVSAMIDISDFFFMPGRHGAARAELDAAVVRVGGAALDLALDVRRTYYALVAARQIVELRRTVLLAARAGYDAAKAMHEAGNITDLALDNERALYEESRLSVAQSSTIELTERERLRMLMGLWQDDRKFKTLERLAEPAAAEPDFPTAERHALDRSMDLLLARKRFTAAAKRANLARAEGLIPDVSAGVAAEREDGEWALGPAAEVEIPLFYQGQGEVARAQAEMRREQRSYAGTAIRIRSAVRATLTRVKVLRQRATFYKNVLMPLRQRIVDETQLQYNAMNVGVFQLLTAKRDQVETARAWVEALRDYWIARAELDQLLAGRLVPLAAMASATSEPLPSSNGTDAH